MKQEIKRGCTLNDAELLERVHDWVSRLCISGGNEWVLSVPVDFNHDPDYLISELCNRYAAKQEEYASKGMPDKENEPVAEEKAMEYAVDFYQSNGALDGMPKSIVDDAHRLAALHFSKGYEYAKHKSNLLYDLLKDHTDETIHAQADRIKELEAENKILKMENSHSKLVVDEAKREIERLRGLVENAPTYGEYEKDKKEEKKANNNL